MGSRNAPGDNPGWKGGENRIRRFLKDPASKLEQDFFSDNEWRGDGNNDSVFEMYGNEIQIDEAERQLIDAQEELRGARLDIKDLEDERGLERSDHEKALASQKKKVKLAVLAIMAGVFVSVVSVITYRYERSQKEEKERWWQDEVTKRQALEDENRELHAELKIIHETLKTMIEASVQPKSSHVQ
ncbi:MAG: hypothetical protein ABL890_03610 [Candidatus Peribacteraceae bacterium]